MSLVTIRRPSKKASTPLRVALVNMPFGSTRFPSIQLGLLKAILDERGIPSDVFYFNLHYAARIGWETYEVVCRRHFDLVGEWIFSRSAFREDAPPPELFLRASAETVAGLRAEIGWDEAKLFRLREEDAEVFVRECLESTDWSAYDVVGFGSMFAQNCAALAMARAIKEKHPGIVTVFGGSNFEDRMGIEYVRAIPWIDYAVLGEGDRVFPALLERLAEGETSVRMPGLVTRSADVTDPGRAPMVEDMSSVPIPIYDEFFETAERLGMPLMLQGKSIWLLFESARGCWWGAKHHCTFCGLNANSMKFRSKPPEQVLATIDELAARYDVYMFQAVDNIMDHGYVESVFGPLRDERKDYSFYYEVKANLTQEQVKLLAAAQVKGLQPGIESLSTAILRLMRKGSTGIQNVRLLKWCAYYGIAADWNILTGFPGEKREDYDVQIATMRLIRHLRPPDGCGPIRLDRFSPYQRSPEEWGFKNVRPSKIYTPIYPKTVDLERIAYFFEHDVQGVLRPEELADLHRALDEWKAAWAGKERPSMTFIKGPDRVTVIDRRYAGQEEVHSLEGMAGSIYEICSRTYHRPATVARHLQESHGIDAGVEETTEILRDLARQGLMLEESDQFLSLALPSNRNW